MERYRRRLPHLDIPGAATFVTWRLRGSLPDERVFHREHATSGEAYAAVDRLLDAARRGPVFLRQTEIAGMVVEELRKADCVLHAHVVMPNHVHVLSTARVELSKLIQQVRGTTAFQANRLLGRTGQVFWQEEYFDRIVRNDRQFPQIKRYIEGNPVTAGLAASPEEFPWSSAGLKPRAA